LANYQYQLHLTPNIAPGLDFPELETFFPKTYVLDYTEEGIEQRIKFMEDKELEGPVISKPPDKGQALGVKVHSSKEEYLKQETFQSRQMTQVVSKYITPPLLYHNRKWHTRLTVVVSFAPLIVTSITSKILLMSPEVYAPNQTTNHHSHITNLSVNKLHPNYEALKSAGFCYTHGSSLMENLSPTPPNDWGSVVLQDMYAIVTYALKALQLYFLQNSIPFATQPGASAIQLLGFDFIHDSDGKSWLMEINDSPLFCGSSNCTMTPPFNMSLVLDHFWNLHVFRQMKLKALQEQLSQPTQYQQQETYVQENSQFSQEQDQKRNQQKKQESQSKEEQETQEEEQETQEEEKGSQQKIEQKKEVKEMSLAEFLDLREHWVVLIDESVSPCYYRFQHLDHILQEHINLPHFVQQQQKVDDFYLHLQEKEKQEEQQEGIQQQEKHETQEQQKNQQLSQEQNLEDILTV